MHAASRVLQLHEVIIFFRFSLNLEVEEDLQAVPIVLLSTENDFTLHLKPL